MTHWKQDDAASHNNKCCVLHQFISVTNAHHTALHYEWVIVGTCVLSWKDWWYFFIHFVFEGRFSGMQRPNSCSLLRCVRRRSRIGKTEDGSWWWMVEKSVSLKQKSVTCIYSGYNMHSVVWLFILSSKNPTKEWVCHLDTNKAVDCGGGLIFQAANCRVRQDVVTHAVGVKRSLGWSDQAMLLYLHPRTHHLSEKITSFWHFLNHFSHRIDEV